MLKYFRLLPSDENNVLEYFVTLKNFHYEYLEERKFYDMNYGVYLQVSLLLMFPCRYCFPVATGGMLLYHCFKTRDGLPDPKGSIFRSVLSATIAFANREMQRVIIVELLLIASHELAGSISPWRWATMEVLTARYFCLRVD